MFCSACLVVVLLVILALLVLALLLRRRSNTFNLSGAHVLVTGGSSGIGLAVAQEVARRGASVTLLARDPEKLAKAKSTVENVVADSSKQKVYCVAVDVAKDYDDVEKAIRQAESALGPVGCLVNSAGFSISGQFEDIPLRDFTRMLEVNYMGSVHATRAVVRSMKQRGARGRIVFVSSQAGQTGLFGFSAYSASKFALRGLAESLQMEVRPYGIGVMLSFPPDTATPGYEEEMKTKPEETRLISESSGLFQADVVARAIVDDAVRGRFLSYVGVDGWLLAVLTSGMAPAASALEVLQQVLAMGLFRAIAIVFLFKFDGIVSRCRVERLQRSATSDETKIKNH